MVIMDLNQEVLGKNIKTRRRRLAVLRYLLRGYTAGEALEELSRRPWWEGWGLLTVRRDMKVLREGIKDYGQALPAVQEAIAWALGYYTDTIKEYDRLITIYERQDRPDLAIRYRNMRDRLAEKAFNALGVNSLNLNISGGSGGSWEVVKEFFGIESEAPASIPEAIPTSNKEPAPPKTPPRKPKKSRKRGAKQRKKSN